MTNRWLLPDHIADVLPAQARQIEETRRSLLDVANRHGFELVMPPLVEHLDSLLIGVGASIGGALDLQTFKLVDQHSGRSLGVRADTTPQVARIDAHLLNRQGLTRLCYCGPVLHTRQATAHATREPLQFGAEIYGHAGLEADLEIMALALSSLAIGKIQNVLIDLCDVRIAAALLAEHQISNTLQANIYQALASKDRTGISEMAELPGQLQVSLQALISLYGSADVLAHARQVLPALPAITAALDGLNWLVTQLMACGVSKDSIRLDLADLGGYGYYTGLRFALFNAKANDALARGGRYDEVGAVFGRSRPAVGFSLDIKAIVDAAHPPAPKPSIRMAWSTDAAQRKVADELRANGETVICILPGHESETEEFACDRELVLEGSKWIVKNLNSERKK